MLHARLTALVLATTTLAISSCGEQAKTTSDAGTPTSSVASAPASSSSSGANEAANAPISPKGGRLTHQELVAKAEAICSRVNKKRATIAVTSLQDYGNVLPLAADEQTAAEELGRLNPPISMTSDWRTIVSDMQAVGYDTRKLGEASRANNLASARSEITSGNVSLTQMISVAKRNGFKNCATTS
ncbi:MAG TPA: hypothetical protein VIJ39_12380 [Solirubrobacteraceae bacterium]